ncbi:hypothetical protein [Kitasatospora cineracea]|uniref:Uncharacterized protein n=1 Tax=Kitasatospora cineracea TaxID=88074 RepID=A0A8G1URH8_9ACTN|nr:hypothetical protein [Kitasatospora cineracea]ROR46494.1 hypothetical protein EDD39_4766 [Kitasatospora cineracea]
MTTTPPPATAEPARPVMLHVGWNIQHGWKLPEAIGLLKQFAQEHGVDRPHLLTLQELQEDQAEKVAEQLGLACVEAPNVRPGSRNALFYDPEMFQPDPDWTAYSTEVRHRPATAKLRLIHPDTGVLGRREMSVASIHLDFGDPDNRQHQIRWLLANMYKHNWLALFQGDMNSWPVWGCPLSLDRVVDRAFALDRSIIRADVTTGPDDVPDRIMTTRHMVDVGRHAATVLGQTGADRATTWDGPKKARQQIPAEDCPPGGLGPIDRTYVSRELEPALLSSATPATPEVEAVSDHLPQVTAWDLRQLWEVMDAEVETVRH